MKKLLFSLSLIGMISLSSCGGGAEDAVVVTDAQDEATASQESERFEVNTGISSVSWRGFKIFDDSSKPEGGHYGSIKLKDGELSFVDGKLESGKLNADLVTIESTDLEDSPEDKAKFEGHLKSEDFLFIEKYPNANFVISDVKELTDGDYNSEISGNLDFRGAPKNVTFKANVKHEDGKATIQSEEFKINRKDFGIDFQPVKGSIIKDDVVLQLNLTADKA